MMTWSSQKGDAIRNPPKKPIWRDEKESMCRVYHQNQPAKKLQVTARGVSISGTFSDVCVRGGHERSLQES